MPTHPPYKRGREHTDRYREASPHSGMEHTHIIHPHTQTQHQGTSEKRNRSHESRPTGLAHFREQIFIDILFLVSLTAVQVNTRRRDATCTRSRSTPNHGSGRGYDRKQIPTMGKQEQGRIPQQFSKYEYSIDIRHLPTKLLT